MVANLSAHKRGWDERWNEFSDWAVKGQALKNKFMDAVDEDTRAFNQIMEAFGMPKETAEEKAARKSAIAVATKHAALVPLSIARLALESFEICREMVEKGNPNSITDAGVGALCARAAVKGAVMNVKVNLKGFEDVEFVKATITEAEKLDRDADELERLITEKVNKAIV
jgi:glutamate formiminotransferase/formiminotetrahydrofolate cyclodeaminase